MSNLLTISEHFVTLQGEGRHLGVPSFFLRMPGCHRQCSWCDTAYTWDGSEKGSKIAVEELQRLIVTSLTRMVVLTGGEPLLHQRNENLQSVLLGARRSGQLIEVETSGDILPNHGFASLVNFWSISPKLQHACQGKDKPIDTSTLRTWRSCVNPSRISLKFVVRGADAEVLAADVREVTALVAASGFGPSHVWLMPEGRTFAEQVVALRAVFDAAVVSGFNATPRSHILAWGAERKR